MDAFFSLFIPLERSKADPTLTSGEVKKIIAGLSFDMADFDLLPFHMVGSVYCNRYEGLKEITAIDIGLTKRNEFYKIDSWLV